MSILAHLSDLHLIERDHHKRRGLARQRLTFLNAGGQLRVEQRIQHALGTLQCARRAGADHVVITGDLTEDGARGQFEVLAEVLHKSGLDPACVTIVPGNHDAYSEVSAFERALEGPLRAFRRTSRPGTVNLLPGVVIAAISTVIEGQWCANARGALRDDDLFAIRRLTSDPVARDRAVVVAQHHPPRRHPVMAMVNVFDGLANAPALRELVLERTRLHVLHGHVHRQTTRHFGGRAHAQVFSTASVRDHHPSQTSLRFYKAEDGMLRELVGRLPNMQPLAASPAQRLSLVAATT